MSGPGTISAKTLLLTFPQTRYPNLHFHRVRPSSVQHLYDADEISASPALRPGSVRVKKTSGIAGGGGTNEASGSEEKAVQSGSAAEDNKENVPKTTSSKEVRGRSLFNLSLNMGVQVLYISEGRVVMGL